MDLYPNTVHVLADNIANANQLWGVLWSETEPQNRAANEKTFNVHDAYEDSTTPGPAPFVYAIRSRITAAQKAELQEFIGGGVPQRWVDEGTLTPSQINTWRSGFTIEFDVQDHPAWLAARNLVPTEV